MKYVKGKKIEMTQIFDEAGNVVPATLIEVKAPELKVGDRVKISGISKGKGFQGVVKRWGFSGRGASHGVKHEARTPGSVGTSFPERVTKGRKMAGRMGFSRVTIRNLKIVRVDAENNLIAVKGAVPGPRGAVLEIKKYGR